MIGSKENNNSSVAKGTLFLYIRMVILMIVTLYTSRVILATLGVQDFGIWNLVASFIVLFSFIQNAMATSIQRFISAEISSNNYEKINRIIYNSNLIYLLVGLLLFILAEFFGNYFLNYVLNIPEDRLSSAFIVFQFVILDTFIKILRLPFDSLILAYERMKFYAIVSLVEAFLSLMIIFFLKFVRFDDKLILYSILLCITSLMINFCFYTFCYKNWKVKFYNISYDRDLFRSIFFFGGWNMLGGGATLLSTQGVNVVVNVFFGVLVNAALGIANQASGAVNKFIYNFQLAYIPRIMRLYSSNLDDDLDKLIIQSAKFSFLLCWLLAFPLILNMPFVLKIWLNNVPEYSVIFCRLILLTYLLECISTPLWITIQASGNIRKYQLVYNSVMLSNIVLSYLALRWGAEVYFVMVVKFFVALLCSSVRLYYFSKMQRFSVNFFLNQVLFKCIAIAVISGAISTIVYFQLSSELNRLLYTSILFLIVVTYSSFKLFLNKEESMLVISFLRKTFKI